MRTTPTGRALYRCAHCDRYSIGSSRRGRCVPGQVSSHDIFWERLVVGV